MCHQGETCHFLFGFRQQISSLLEQGIRLCKLTEYLTSLLLKIALVSFQIEISGTVQQVGSCKSNLLRNSASLWPRNAAECICRQLANPPAAFLDLKMYTTFRLQHNDNHLFIGTYVPIYKV